MYKILFVLFLFCVVKDILGGSVEEIENKNEDSGRQKRLLFYDEEGNIVKTYTNPFLRNYYLNQGSIPGVGFLSPFLEFLRPPQLQSLPNPIKYMLPLSDIASQQNPNDLYQNKLFFQLKDQSIEFNPLCSNKRVQIPSPRSCSNFLNCWDGWAYEQECPQGLMFSNQGFCDYAENVNCNDRKGVVQDEPQSQEEATCSKEFDTFRNEARCSEFFVCVNRVPVKFTCPESLFFNQELGVCDYQNRVSCNAGVGIAPEVPTSQAQSSGQETSSSAMPPAAPTLAPAPMAQAPMVSAPMVNAPMVPAPMAQAPMPMPQKDDKQPKPIVKLFMMGNTMTNTQSWSSTRVAMGRQDAIRQLELNRLAKVKANY